MRSANRQLLSIVLLAVSPVVVYYALNNIILVLTGMYAIYAVGAIIARILQLRSTYRRGTLNDQSESGESLTP